jgi:WD40 repeat protein
MMKLSKITSIITFLANLAVHNQILLAMDNTTKNRLAVGMIAGADTMTRSLERKTASASNFSELPKDLHAIVDTYSFNPWDYIEAFQEHNGIRPHTFCIDGKINEIIYLNNNKIASCADNDKTIKIWDLSTGKCIATLRGHSGSVISITQLADGKIASCSYDYHIKIWDLSTEQCVATLTGHSFSVKSIIQLSDGKIASCSYDHTIKIWDVKTEKCIATLRGHKHLVSSIIQLQDGRIASGSYDCYIKIWDISDMAHPACVATMEYGSITHIIEGTYIEFKESITTIIQLPDGKIASGSIDGTIKLWDLATQKCLVTLRGHKLPINSIIQLTKNRIASSSSTTFYAGEDDTIKIWDVSDIAHAMCVATLSDSQVGVDSITRLANNRIASCSRTKKTIDIWEFDSEQLKMVYKGLQELPLEPAPISKTAIVSVVADTAKPNSRCSRCQIM